MQTYAQTELTTELGLWFFCPFSIGNAILEQGRRPSVGEWHGC